MDMVTLRNLTKQQLPVPGTAGELIFDAAGTEDSELALDPATANDVLETYGRDKFEIVNLDAISATYVPAEKPETIWIANMTGNPDAAAEVGAGKMKNRETGRVEVVRVENVNKIARSVRMEMKGAQGFYKDKEGLPQGFNKLPTIVEIPAYQRREMKLPIGKWVLHRDAMAPLHEKGAVIESRDHTEFEPRADWKIDELHAYLAYIDPRCRKDGLCGPAEDEITAKYDGKKLAAELRKVRLKALKRLHFRVCNPKVLLPTEGQFQRYLKELETGEWAAPEDEAVMEAFTGMME